MNQAPIFGLFGAMPSDCRTIEFSSRTMVRGNSLAIAFLFVTMRGFLGFRNPFLGEQL